MKRTPHKISAKETSTLLNEKSFKNFRSPNVILNLVFTAFTSDSGSDSKSQNAIAQINRYTHQFFKHGLLKARHTKLLHHVLYGELDEVKKMLEMAYEESKVILERKDEKIELKKSTVLYRLLCTIDISMDRSNRRIEGTPYRMAIGAKDVSRKDHPDEGMADLIAEYMKKLPDGESLIVHQKQEQKLPEIKVNETKEEKAQREATEQKYYDAFFQPLIDAITTEEFKGKSNYQYYYLKVNKAPTNDSINTLLPFENQGAYVRCDNDMYYVDRNNKHCIKLIVDDARKLNQEMKAEEGLTKSLTVTELHNMQRCVRHLLVNEKTESNLNQFRKKIEPKSNEVIKKGFHFDDQLLLKSYEKYEAKYGDFGGWDSFKNNLFWRQVIGYIQRYLPSCLAQGICQGLYFVVDENKKLERSVTFVDGVPFFLFTSLTGLGIEYAAGRQRDGGAAAATGFDNLLIDPYLKQKHPCYDNPSASTPSHGH